MHYRALKTAQSFRAFKCIIEERARATRLRYIGVVTRRLLFFPDYAADPLWDARGNGIDLDALPVSPQVRTEARDWSRRWEQLASAEMAAEAFAAGGSSGPADPVAPEVWAQHECAGRAVLDRLQTELGDTYEVVWVGPDDQVDHVG
jgi:hypothetical protein